MATNKTRMSAVVDHSTMGLSLGTEMSISKGTHDNLRRALARACKSGLAPFACTFKLASGDPLRGNAVFLLEYPKNNGETVASVYEFKTQGKNYFLNTSGNPTTLLSGANDIPVLVQGYEYGDYNSATITFKYLNRIMYAVLERLLEPFDFVFAPSDRKRLVEGDITIQKYQIAWYSGDLGDQRDAIFRWLRVIYGGQDATVERVRSVGEAVGLVTRLWDNTGNLTLEARNGSNRSFSLSWYAKDQQPLHRDNKHRLCQLIRWDCTLNHSFLSNNNIRTLRELETRYAEQCALRGYDVGFVRWVADKVCTRLNFQYLLNLDVEQYRRAIEVFEDFRGAAATRRVITHWLTYTENTGATPFALDVGVDKSNFSRIRRQLLDAHGIDVVIPRSYHEALLENRVLAQRSLRERAAQVLARGPSNAVVPWEVLVGRDHDAMCAHRATLTNAANVVAVRRFRPKKVKPEQFWIYRHARTAA